MTTKREVPREIEARLRAAKKAAEGLRRATGEQKNATLIAAARGLEQSLEQILAANAADMASLPADATPAFRDRLRLDAPRIAHMVESLRQVAALPDPVNVEVDRRTLESGLIARRVRSPLGVILVIFESRPNVAVEAFSIGFKAGNVMILRGGKESMRTTAALYAVIDRALVGAGLAQGALWGITDPDRMLTALLLEQERYIDVVVPRGGEGLIEAVVRGARMPVIKNDRGVCHVYVHADADLNMAAEIVTNAKCQRPGVCNALETLLVHRAIASVFLPRVYERLATHDVAWFGCDETVAILGARPRVSHATAQSFDTEYLDFAMSARVVGSLDEAIEHIAEHGSGHSEAIVTASEAAAREFQARVDAAAVYWNASTRFTDGFELGLGGELGISTQKLHVRGPVGPAELTSVRWIIDGTGQVRS